MIPFYVGFKTLDWVNSFKPLIVPAFFGSAFYIFLLRQFFLTLPPEMEDAARVDGASTLQIIWHIILPISRPAMATVAIVTFQATWNDFLAPLIYLHDHSKYTISLGLSFSRSSYGIRWGYLMAASLVTMLPVILVFFLAQRQFIKGITITGLKSRGSPAQTLNRVRFEPGGGGQRYATAMSRRLLSGSYAAKSYVP